MEAPVDKKSEEKQPKQKGWWRAMLLDKMFFENLPFILFLTFLGMLYITNSYNVEQNVREVEEVKKAIVKQKNIFVNTKTRVSIEGQRNEIIKRVDSLGIKESAEPPYIIQLNKKD